MSLKGAWKRMLAGMPLIMTQAQGPGRIAFSRDAPGEMIALPLQPGQAVDVREHLFMVATGAVTYDWFNSNIWFTTQEGDETETHYPMGMLLDRFQAPAAPGPAAPARGGERLRAPPRGRARRSWSSRPPSCSRTHGADAAPHRAPGRHLALLALVGGPLSLAAPLGTGPGGRAVRLRARWRTTAAPSSTTRGRHSTSGRRLRAAPSPFLIPTAPTGLTRSADPGRRGSPPFADWEFPGPEFAFSTFYESRSQPDIEAKSLIPVTLRRGTRDGAGQGLEAAGDVNW